MSTFLAWLIPFVVTIGLLVVLAKLGKSAKKLSRQTKRLDKQLVAFRASEHQVSKADMHFKLSTPEDASKKRQSYLVQRTKNKSDRQRRLLKRLRNLKSEESE